MRKIILVAGLLLAGGPVMADSELDRLQNQITQQQMEIDSLRSRTNTRLMELEQSIDRSSSSSYSTPLSDRELAALPAKTKMMLKAPNEQFEHDQEISKRCISCQEFLGHKLDPACTEYWAPPSLRGTEYEKSWVDYHKLTRERMPITPASSCPDITNGWKSLSGR